MKRDLYLDVDGVLLGKERPGDVQIILAKHAAEFLRYCLNRFECYWFTTHCKDGDTTHVLELLRRYADNTVIKLASGVKPVYWRTLKTEAIDPRSNFYIIDDHLLWTEAEWLSENSLLNRWIQVDTRKDPEDLKRAITKLKAQLA